MKLYRVFRKSPFFLNVSSWITKSDDPIKSGPNSRKAIMVPLLVMQYGSIKAKLRSFRYLTSYMKPLFMGMRISAKSIQQNPKKGKRRIDENTLNEMEAYARELGISSFGYTKVNPNFIFKDFEILYDNAIIVSMEMIKERIDTNPSLESTEEIVRTYRDLGIAVNKIAEFLRERGYNCMASPALGGDINTVPTAQDANMGYIGRNGILISPEFGPCMRLAAVFIDVENLPFAGENEHAWVADFCESCKRCIKECPDRAIYDEPKILDDGTPVYIDAEKCAPEFSYGCSRCISKCVFTGGHYEKIKAAYTKHKEKALEKLEESFVQ